MKKLLCFFGLHDWSAWLESYDPYNQVTSATRMCFRCKKVETIYIDDQEDEE